MIRRNKRYAGIRYNDTVKFPPSQTSQDEPNLRDILVAYSRGQDVSEFIRKPAAKATAEQQFTNRIGKMDFLTEIPDYIKQQSAKAHKAVELDKLRSNSKESTEKQDQTKQDSE